MCLMIRKISCFTPTSPIKYQKIFIMIGEAYGAAFVASFGVYIQEPHPRCVQSVDQHLLQVSHHIWDIWLVFCHK